MRRPILPTREADELLCGADTSLELQQPATRHALRQRRTRSGNGALATAAMPSLPNTRSLSIDISSGHLGVTLSNGVCGKVTISRCHDGDLFAAAGLKAGDVIVAVDGRTVDSHQAAFAAINRAVGSLRLEYWTAAEAREAAKILMPNSLLQRMSVGAQVGLAAIVLLVLAAVVYFFSRNRHDDDRPTIDAAAAMRAKDQLAFGGLGQTQRTPGGRFWNLSSWSTSGIPCIVYVTAPRWTQALATLWSRNLRNTSCKLRFHDDEALVRSAAESGIDDAVASVAPWAFKSDLWRYSVIWRTGGLFFDAEMELLVPPTRMFDLARGGLQVVTDRPPNRCVYNAAFASAAYDATLGAVLDHALANVEARSYGFNDSQAEPWLGITGPCAMAAAVAGRNATVVATYDGDVVRCGQNKSSCIRNVEDVKYEFTSAHYGGTWEDRRVYHEPSGSGEYGGGGGDRAVVGDSTRR